MKIDDLGLEGEAKVTVTERFTKLMDLVGTIKTLDEKIKTLGEHLKDALIDIPKLGVKATAKIQVTIANPFAAADKKKEAEEAKKKVDDIVSGFSAKISDWQKALTDLPGKAKELPGKLAKSFKG